MHVLFIYPLLFVTDQTQSDAPADFQSVLTADPEIIPCVMEEDHVCLKLHVIMGITLWVSDYLHVWQWHKCIKNWESLVPKLPVTPNYLLFAQKSKKPCLSFTTQSLLTINLC